MPALLVRARPWLSRTRLMIPCVGRQARRSICTATAQRLLYCHVKAYTSGSARRLTVLHRFSSSPSRYHLILRLACTSFIHAPFHTRINQAATDTWKCLSRGRLHCHPPDPWSFSRLRITASGWIRLPQSTVVSREQPHRLSSKAVGGFPGVVECGEVFLRCLGGGSTFIICSERGNRWIHMHQVLERFR